MKTILVRVAVFLFSPFHGSLILFISFVANTFLTAHIRFQNKHAIRQHPEHIRHHSFIVVGHGDREQEVNKVSFGVTLRTKVLVGGKG